jgi:hypothetical protein
VFAPGPQKLSSDQAARKKSQAVLLAGVGRLQFVAAVFGPIKQVIMAITALFNEGTVRQPHTDERASLCSVSPQQLAALSCEIRTAYSATFKFNPQGWL